MASPLHPLLFYYSFFFFFFSPTILSQAATPLTSSQQKTTHLHFYFHDVIVGTASAGNTSTVRIIQSTPNSLSAFGLTTVIDDMLTETEDPTSPELGRAQGTYSAVSQSEVTLLMNMNLVFTAGEWKGSSLSIVGRNPVMNKVREMPVVGGTGKFRLALGYALANTVVFDPPTGNAVVEYNVYVKIIDENRDH